MNCATCDFCSMLCHTNAHRSTYIFLFDVDLWRFISSLPRSCFLLSRFCVGGKLTISTASRVFRSQFKSVFSHPFPVSLLGFFPGFFLGFSSDSLFLFHSCPLLSSITFQTGLSDSFWTKDSDLPEIDGRLAFWDAQMLANLFWAPVTALSIFTPLYRKLCLETISSKWGCLQSIFSCCEFQYCSFGKYKFLKCCFSAFNNLIKKRLHNLLLTEQKTKTWDRKV